MGNEPTRLGLIKINIVSSHSQKFFKKGILKTFARLTGKQLCRSLFLISLQLTVFFKRRLRHSCFLVKFTNFLKTLFLQSTSRRLLWIIFAVDHICYGSGLLWIIFAMDQVCYGSYLYYQKT